MKVFDEYAQKYDEWYEKPFGRSAFRLELECLRRLSVGSPLSLEVGVGSGRFASSLGISFGVDTSKELLKIAKNRGIKAILARAEELPFKDELFDEVYMVVSICFFESPILALKEAYRVLKPKGRLILGLILYESPWAKFYLDKAKKGHPLYSKAKFYSFEELNYMLKEAGFKLDRIFTTLFDEPQDEREVRCQEVREGFHAEGGFFCLLASKAF
jgi:ubiquinone/menaquinone biosynthesis C-methylase UbiE